MNKRDVIAIVVLIVTLVTLITILEHYKGECRQVNMVNIPSPAMIDEYCQAHGYDYGWTSSACAMDEVECAKKLDADTTRFSCVVWR